jgi:alkanesulfonate monooxygenase SsuD/methylene tetrahydromethanopterin reductase-like flavin-dependent oxidoreductase (luciferase family)
MTFPSTYGLFYDFRNPEAWRQPWDERYRQLLEQIAWVDAELPFDQISLSEHHFVEDGYSPSVLALAAAVAMRTSRVGIVTNILQLPLHHPLRVAEDSLTVDILSGGRFRLGVAVGYRELEFEALGVSTRERGTRMDEGLEILRLAFSGDRFSFQGTHWQLPDLRVTPGPMREGGPEIWLGGKAPRAIERAAMRGDGFLASKNADVTAYLAARRRLGHVDLPPKTVRTARLLICEEPDRALAELGGYLLHQVNQYVEFGFIPGPPYTDPSALLRDGHYEIVDATGARETLAAAGAAGVGEFHLMAVLPGEPVESGSARLEYVARHVLPHLRPALEGAP